MALKTYVCHGKGIVKGIVVRMDRYMGMRERKRENEREREREREGEKEK